MRKKPPQRHRNSLPSPAWRPERVNGRKTSFIVLRQRIRISGSGGGRSSSESQEATQLTIASCEMNSTFQASAMAARTAARFRPRFSTVLEHCSLPDATLVTLLEADILPAFDRIVLGGVPGAARRRTCRVQTYVTVGRRSTNWWISVQNTQIFPFKFR